MTSFDVDQATAEFEAKEDDYGAIEAINWSSLKLIDESPLFYKFRLSVPEKDKTAYALGRAMHCAVLEPEVFESRFACFDGVRNKRHKVYQEWLEENDGKHALSTAEMALVRGMAEAVLGHPIARDLIRGGRAEEVVQWTDATGIPCKARLDYITPHGLIDLKSTRHIKPSLFVSEFSRLRYHGQLSWYHDGALEAKAMGSSAQLPHVIAVENTRPHDVAVYRFTTETYAAGRALYQSLMVKYRDCQAADWWPGVAPALLNLELPPWAPTGLFDSTEDF